MMCVNNLSLYITCECCQPNRTKRNQASKQERKKEKVEGNKGLKKGAMKKEGKKK